MLLVAVFVFMLLVAVFVFMLLVAVFVFMLRVAVFVFMLRLIHPTGHHARKRTQLASWHGISWEAIPAPLSVRSDS